jgi:hypothetical protein
MSDEQKAGASISAPTLLPCPFCGGVPKEWIEGFGRYYGCEACDFSLDTPEEWNRRAPLVNAANATTTAEGTQDTNAHTLESALKAKHE